MLARVATEADRAALQEMGRAMGVETRPHLVYDPARADVFISNGLATLNPLFIVVERAGEVVGFLVARKIEFAAFAGFCAQQEILYVRPEHRGSRAAATLVLAFNRWADHINAEEVFMGINAGRRPQAATRWLRRFGFNPLGSCMHRVGVQHEQRRR